jgi:hypothetical protein
MKVIEIPLNKFKYKLFTYTGEVLNENSNMGPKDRSEGKSWLFEVIPNNETIFDEDVVNVRKVEFPVLDYGADKDTNINVKVYIATSDDLTFCSKELFENLKKI